MDVTTLTTHNLICGYKETSKEIAFPSYELNISINKPMLIAVIGRNGVGKSTLLKTLAGLQKPLKGSIYINEKPINKIKINQRACYISFLPAFNSKIQYIQVKDYVAMGLFPYSKPQNASIIIDDAMQQADIYHKKNYFLNQLSDGEMQRAAIARVLVQNTPIMLFDEATSHLDPKHQHLTLELFYSLCHQKNKTVIFSTHTISEAMNYAHKIWLLGNHSFIEKIPEQIIIDDELKKNELLFEMHPLKRHHSRSQIYIRLVGDGLPLKYTQYALHRYGINTECNHNCHFSVIIKQHSFSKTVWLLKKDNMILKEFDNLYQLIEYLFTN
ncbi:MAG: ABC transporter ATP-binding protein [Bacteroidales bacterium]|nr:ABC transporter ATP-binding protein [Bacteroidales bacterium]